MKVYFKTNLDWYRSVTWPVLDIVPRKGETVNVHIQSESFCKSNNIPQQLEVVGVTYFYDRVEVELWYREIDVRAAGLVENGLEHLYCQ